MRRSFLFAILFGFCGGIILAEFFIVPLAAAVWALAGAIALFSWPRLRWLGLVVACLVFGAWRFEGWIAAGPNGLDQLIGKRVALTGDLVDAPTPRESQQEFELIRVIQAGRELSGKISVRLPTYPAARLGERLTVACEIKSFSDRSRLRHRMHNVRAYCGQPEILDRQTAPWTLRLVLGRVKAWAINRLASQLVEPQASLLIGILLGRQVPMPPDLDAAFRATGTTHIIALSGFNVTIIIVALSAVLVRAVGKRWAWMPALLFVVGFVIMTGASASVTRAGLMASVVLVALRFGRPVSMLRLLIYSLIGMVLHNPLILVHDLGFQLSFLATAGLVYAAPAIQAGLRFLPQSFSIRENFGTTLGAIIMTEPLLLWHFARVSLVAPLVNVMILPMIPLAMAFGFVSLLFPPAWPITDAVLRRIIGAIQFGADQPFAMQDVSGWWAAVIAMFVAAGAAWLIFRHHASKTCVA